jgi:hypothetical protein
VVSWNVEDLKEEHLNTPKNTTNKKNLSENGKLLSDLKEDGDIENKEEGKESGGSKEGKIGVRYKIVIQSRYGKWIVWRRYSEFFKLHTELCNAFEFSKEMLPTFPSKSLTLNQKSVKFLENRRYKLNVYMNAVVNTCSYQKKALALFLDPMLNENDVEIV